MDRQGRRPDRRQAARTWLISEKEYSDFVLECEIKLTERGNSGIARGRP